MNTVIRKGQVELFVGAASSRDHFVSRLEAAPTDFFYGDLDFPDKRQDEYPFSCFDPFVLSWLIVLSVNICENLRPINILASEPYSLPASWLSSFPAFFTSRPCMHPVRQS